MREIDTRKIADAVARLFQEANFELGEDVLGALRKAQKQEVSETGRKVISRILENAVVAAEEKIPLCQDCGVAVVFLELGEDVNISGGGLYDAVNQGVRRAYEEGYLRKSMVSQPFSERKNTGDNTPAVIHTDIVPGDKLKINVMPKGAGAENMTRLGMLSPAQGKDGVIDFVLKAVEDAGGSPCPPIIVGVGIGGTAEKALLLAKRALMRPLGTPGADAEVAELEKDILHKVNNLGIGPAGYGGRITALGVHVETFPAHIASLPVAVNLQCHSSRHKEIIL